MPAVRNQMHRRRHRPAGTDHANECVLCLRCQVVMNDPQTCPVLETPRADPPTLAPKRHETDYLFTAGWRVSSVRRVVGSVISVAIWLMWLTGLVDGDHLGVAPQTWHAHEMIFGYATAAMGEVS